jgi:hypothetical protein
MNENMRRARGDLLFGVRRSVRYHSRRSFFFDRLSTYKNVLVLFFGSATAFVVVRQLGPEVVAGAAVLVSLVGAIDLVIGTAKMARLHQDLMRRWLALEKDILGVREEAFDHECLCRFGADRLDIFAEEPPPLRVLNCMVHNELARAIGCHEQDFVPIRWYQRLFAQWFDLREDTLRLPHEPAPQEL